MKDFLEKLMALFTQMGVVKDDNKKQIQDALDKLAKDSEEIPKIDKSKITDENLLKFIEAFESRMNVLAEQNKTLLNTLTAEREAREKSIQTQETEAKTLKEQKIKDAVQQVIAKGKYPESARDALIKSAAADLESFTTLHELTTVNPNFQGGTADKSKQGDDSKKIHTAMDAVNPGILKAVQDMQNI